VKVKRWWVEQPEEDGQRAGRVPRRYSTGKKKKKERFAPEM
jgi:hypothetical protein